MHLTTDVQFQKQNSVKLFKATENKRPIIKLKKTSMIMVIKLAKPSFVVVLEKQPIRTLDPINSVF